MSRARASFWAPASADYWTSWGWAIFPAGAMAALAVVVLGESAGVRVPAGFRGFNELFGPAFLIAVGAWLLMQKGREAS